MEFDKAKFVIQKKKIAWPLLTRKVQALENHSISPHFGESTSTCTLFVLLGAK